MDWPLREALISYSERMKLAAAEQHKFELLMWAISNAFGGKRKPPRLPEILREQKPFEVVGGGNDQDATDQQP